MADSQRLQAILRTERSPRVLIVGDLIVDRYVSGEVTRISPEAPIPVLAAKTTECRLGGAGNVAANLRAMGAEVCILGVIGDDGHGRLLRELLGAEGIDESGVVVDQSRPTIEKTRMMSGVQQMLRVDWEDARPIDGEVLDQLKTGVAAQVRTADSVVLSDYGKGTLPIPVLRFAIEEARRHGIPVLVDPKGTDYSRYAGASLVTPNRREAELAVGYRIESREQLKSAAEDLMKSASLEQTLITLGADGIYFRSRGGELEGLIPTQARAVFDVTGAGDTVVSHLALHLGAGLTLADSVALANHAAGIVVAKLGTHSVSRDELIDRLHEGEPDEGKILDSNSVGGHLDQWRADGRRIVFTNGCFDVLHAGHVSYLRFARSRGDRLIVGVNSDESVSRLKGPRRPVVALADRMALLAALEFVDAVIPFEDDTPKGLVELVSPDVLVKGEDYADKLVVGREWVENHGGQVVLAPLLEGRSTTNILGRASARTSGSAGGTEGGR